MPPKGRKRSIRELSSVYTIIIILNNSKPWEYQESSETVQPPAKDGVNIPRNGNFVPDKLKYVDVNDVLPLPDISKFVRDFKLTPEAVNILTGLLVGYRELVLKQFVEMFNLFATYINSAEDYLQFYTQIYSHCDATTRNLIQNKVVSLFKDDIKSDILEQGTQKKMKGKKSSGLFGGQYPINSFEL